MVTQAYTELTPLLAKVDDLYRRRRESQAQWDLFQDAWTAVCPRVVAVLKALEEGNGSTLDLAVDVLGRTKL